MTASFFTRRTALVSALAAVGFLSACGSSDDPSTSISITPALGAIYGATVEAYDTNGRLLGSSTTAAKGTSTQGKATLVLSNYASGGNPIVIRVKMAGATYYNEATNADVAVPSTSTDVLLSVASSATSGATLGVTPLTHLAAQLAGVSPSNVGSAITASLTSTNIATAVAKTNKILGLPVDTNLLAAPTPATSATSTPDLMGKILANLAVAANTAGSNPLAQALALAASVNSSGAVTSATVITAINTRLAAVASGIGLSAVSAPVTTGTVTVTASEISAAQTAVSSGKAPATGTGTGTGTGTSSLSSTGI